MKIKHLRVSKSKTIGVLTSNGQTKFQKVQVEASGEVDDNETEMEAYEKTSKFIDDCFVHETTKK